MKKLDMKPNGTKGFLFTFCGLDGCGKTTIAKVIAAKLGRPGIEVERLISMKAGVPLSTV